LVLTAVAYAHVLSAVGWLGGGLLTAFVIGPGLQTMSGPSRLEFIARFFPKLLRYIGGMILGTFVFGLLLLYLIVGGNFALLSPSTTFGASLSAGIALAVIAGINAVAVTFPSFGKMASMAEAALRSGQQPPPEMASYAKRARMGSIAGAALLLTALVMMVAAGFY
jgi:uncharacterized membrane protein